MNCVLGWSSVNSTAIPLEWGTLYGGLVAGGLGLLLLPTTRLWLRWVGLACGVTGLGLVLISLPDLQDRAFQAVFGALAAITILSSAATVTSSRPLYAALWFALSLIGVASLFLVQGAQFLGVATVAVYAGAVVVMFLFVVMLAQPEGSASYDRISWGWYVPPLAVTAGVLLTGLVAWQLLSMKPAESVHRHIDFETYDVDDNGQLVGAEIRSWMITADDAEDEEITRDEWQERKGHYAGGVFDKAHMAGFGAALFGRRLVSVEIAGTLLLVALVAAVAIMIHGKRSQEGSLDE